MTNSTPKIAISKKCKPLCTTSKKTPIPLKKKQTGNSGEHLKRRLGPKKDI